MDDDEPVDDVEPAETEGQRQGRALVEGLAVSLLGVGVSLVVPGVGGAVASAATGSLLPAWEVMRHRARDRVERTVADGVNSAGRTPADFTAWVSADARHQGLLLAVVEAAARSTAEAHLDALAWVLADGCRDDARVDLDTLVARALGDLGPAHLQVLAFLCHEDPDAGERVSKHSTDALAVQMPHLGEGMAALVAALTATGCVAVEAGGFGGGPTGYRVTTFGRACLMYRRDDGPDGEEAKEA